MTIYLGEDDNLQDVTGKPVPFYIINIHVIGSDLVIPNEKNFIFKTNMVKFQTELYEEYVVKMTCSSRTYGKTCWYKCTDTIRINCNCTASKSYHGTPCYSYCNPG